VHGSDSLVDPRLFDRVRTECRGRLCVHKNGNAYKPRRFIVTTGFGPSHNMGVCNNNVDVMCKAMVERYFLCKEGDLFRPAYDVKPNAYASGSLKNFRNLVMSFMPSLPRLTRSQVVDCYRGPKRRVYEDAMLSLQRETLTEEDSRLTSFVKYGKQDVSKAARIINPRNPRYNLELGRFLKHAEHHYFTAINRAFGNRTRSTVIKGFNADVSAAILREKWDRFDDPVALGLDATKFDMHVSIPALKYEHSFYRALFPGSRRLSDLLRWQLVNRGTAYLPDGNIKFKMYGTRSSGDLNTSLGNCIIMCGLIHAYLTEKRVHAELANNGDDCVLFMERVDLQRFMVGFDGWFKRKGFSIVLEEPVYMFERIDFCQTRPVLLSTGWRMLRTHDAVMTKDPMCLVPITSNKAYRKWLGAVGECGTIATTGCPVQHAFYQKFVDEGVKASRAHIDYVYRGASMLQKIDGLAAATVDARSRVSYYYAFGVLPDSQIEIENYYSQLRISDYVVSAHCEREDLVIEPNNCLLV